MAVIVWLSSQVSLMLCVWLCRCDGYHCDCVTALVSMVVCMTVVVWLFLCVPSDGVGESHFCIPVCGRDHASLLCGSVCESVMVHVCAPVWPCDCGSG